MELTAFSHTCLPATPPLPMVAVIRRGQIVVLTAVCAGLAGTET